MKVLSLSTTKRELESLLESAKFQHRITEGWGGSTEWLWRRVEESITKAITSIDNADKATEGHDD